LTHDSLDVLITGHTGRAQKVGSLWGKGLGSLRDAVNVLAITYFSDKKVVIRAGKIAAYTVPFNLKELEALSFTGQSIPCGKNVWRSFWTPAKRFFQKE
jgi:hypothetical protein